MPGYEDGRIRLALAANGVVAVSGPPPWKGEEAKGQWTALAYDPKDGKALWYHGVPGEPMANGLLIDRAGQVIIALKSGDICCLAAR